MTRLGGVRVRLSTTEGDILIETNPGAAPASAGAFLRYADEGRFADVMFARAVHQNNDQGRPAINVLQTLPVGEGVEHLSVPHESTAQTGLTHDDGVVSLARLDPGTASPAAFFVCIGDQHALDHGGPRQADGLGFAAFGRVVEGMDVVRKIHSAEALAEAAIPYLNGQMLAEPVAIISARREGDSAKSLLSNLAEDYWEFRAREHPSEATAAGDHRYNDRLEGAALGDHERRAALATAMLHRARAIAADDLGDDEALSLGLLIGQLETLGDGWRLGDHLTPRLFPFGFTELPAYLLGGAPLQTRKDFEDFVARLNAVPVYFEACLETLQTALSRGYRLPRALASRVRGLIDAQIADSGIAAIVRARFSLRPAGVDQPTFKKLLAAAERALETAVAPAFQAVLAFFMAHEGDLYRDTISICDQPDGPAYYRFKVRQQTTTDLDPDAIHAIGLGEVRAIQDELADVLSQAGFEGDARTYYEHLASSCIAPDAQSLLDRTRAIAKTIDGGLPRLFGCLPRITYAVQSFSEALSLQRPVAMAQAAPGDRTLPGIFWLTALPERCPTYLLIPLSLHEAWPGHLMQFALAQELDHLPKFRRQTSFDYNAYIEGWALYCERLGYDLGLYDDPRDRFGQLTYDLFRAARLVVDTGIHWKGWTRDEAINYMADNSLLPLDTIEAEIDRYIGMPAQALSYKIGERAIRSLREEAQAKLGSTFSLREFHDAVLETGAVSLAALQQHIRRWVARRVAGNVAAVAS